MGALGSHSCFNCSSGCTLQPFAPGLKPTLQKGFRCHPAAFQQKNVLAAVQRRLKRR
jgi:hypothetical protein